MDKDKIEKAIALLIEGLGEEPNREGLVETPARVARMYEEICAGYKEDVREHLSKQFSVDNSGIVVERDITFYSTCEHHLMPFYGKIAIAYVPNGKVVGISKLARTVEVYARRLQIQERMTGQIADALMEYLGPQGVAVRVEAEHTCMTMRGVKKPGSKTITIAARGCFENNYELQSFLNA